MNERLSAVVLAAAVALGCSNPLRNRSSERLHYTVAAQVADKPIYSPSKKIFSSHKGFYSVRIKNPAIEQVMASSTYDWSKLNKLDKNVERAIEKAQCVRYDAGASCSTARIQGIMKGGMGLQVGDTVYFDVDDQGTHGTCIYTPLLWRQRDAPK
jgi:hypothetical protein